MSEILKVNNLSLIHKPSGHLFLVDVNVGIQKGKVMALVGESGAGKSMLTKVILGVLPKTMSVYAGEVLFDGNSLVAMPERVRRKWLAKDVAMIPQDPQTALNPVRLIKHQAIESILALGMKKNDAYRYICEILEKIKIKDPERVMNSYPHSLSGGMRQRLLIACAFAKKPRLIIADEPTTALDVTVQKEVLILIKQLQADYQTTLLFITHDLGLVASIADDVSVLFRGCILEHGPIEQVLRNPTHRYTKALIDASPDFDSTDLPKPIDEKLIRSLYGEVNAKKDGVFQHAAS